MSFVIAICEALHSAPYSDGHPRSPDSLAKWTAERLIGSIRRDCLDHIVIFGEQHLRLLLNSE